MKSLHSDHLNFFILLNMINGIGPVRMLRLLDVFQDPPSVFQASISQLTKVDGINFELAQKIISHKDNIDLANKEMELTEKMSVHILTIYDDNYPKQLKSIDSPPPLIYYRGNIEILQRQSIAIVGSRTPTHYGKQVTAELTKNICTHGLITLSGMARGVDGIVHHETIASKSETVAVLGSGLAKIYPSEHKGLAHKIQNNGVLISEYPLNTSPLPSNFPKRNRLIAGLSISTLVTEATEKSGALLTAQWALEQSKDIFAVPGDIFSSYSSGTNLLIQQGAKLVRCAKDIFDELGIHYSTNVLKVKNNRIKKESLVLQKIYNHVGVQPVGIDTLSEKCQIPIPDMLRYTLELQIRKFIRLLPGKLYVRNG